MKLLFTCVQWHGLAKLRMHTDQTLDIFDSTTTRIGAELRFFADTTCLSFDTKELQKEVAARERRQTVADATGSAATTISKPSGIRQKRFSLRSYKYHALGDHARTVRELGTCDSFSSEPVGVYFTHECVV